MDAGRAGRSDAAQIALGSSLVLGAGLIDQVSRFALTWMLAAGLGAETFGTWTVAVTVVTLLGAFSPMGLQSGVILFGARSAATDDREGLAGAVWGGLACTALFAAVISALLVALAPSSEVGRLVAALTPAVWLHAVLFVLVSVGRAVKDLRIQAVAWQGALPIGILLGSIGALAGAWSLPAAFLVAYAIAVAVAAALVWRRLGPVLLGPARFDLRALLGFSAPQGVADVAYKLTLSMDVLVLGYLATLEGVGAYRVAASIALAASLPVMAVHTAVTPMVAELVHLGETERLDSLVKTLTRWLVLGAAPLYLVLMLLGDAALSWLDGAYTTATAALVVLLVGQAVHVACAVVVPLVPMAGRSGLEMANGLFILALTVALNLWLVPWFGPLGAAMASACAFSVWAGLRVGQAWWLFAVFPFDRRALGLIAAAVATGAAAAWLGHGATLATRAALVTLALASYAACALTWGLTASDREAWRRLRGRWPLGGAPSA